MVLREREILHPCICSAEHHEPAIFQFNDSRLLCDNITGVTLDQSDAAGTNENHGFTIGATSSTGKPIHVIYGGRHLGSFTSGGTFTLNWNEKIDSGCAKNCDSHNIIPIDQFHATQSTRVWLVSEDGGSAVSGAVTAREFGDAQQTSLTNYPGSNWPYAE